jgi:hypothetical protein
MNQTAKNWLTTIAATALLPAIIYLTSNAPTGDTWVLWRPILIAALGMFLTSVYHSYQESSSATGLASKLKAGAIKVVGTILFAFGFVVALAMMLCGCSNGVPTPQTQTIIQDSAALALCVEQVYQKDESASPPVGEGQVIVDEGVTCEPEAAALASAIGQDVSTSSKAALVAKAHAQVKAKLSKAAK